LENIEREFQDMDPGMNPDMDPGMNPGMNPAIQAGAALAAESYVRNRVRAIQADENVRRRSGRVSNWTGPIAKREYDERRLRTRTDLELDKQKEREDRAAVTEITGGYTKDYLTKWITRQGWRQPNSKYIQDYWDLVLGRTVPMMLSQPPKPGFPSTSSSPIIDLDTLDNIYTQNPNTRTDSLLYQPGFSEQAPSGQIYKQLNFGRRKNKMYDVY
jgi:hypothetical protein